MPMMHSFQAVQREILEGIREELDANTMDINHAIALMELLKKTDTEQEMLLVLQGAKGEYTRLDFIVKKYLEEPIRKSREFAEQKHVRSQLKETTSVK